MIVQGKQEILKKWHLILKKEIFSAFLVAYEDAFPRIDLKRLFFKVYEIFLFSCINAVIGVTLNLVVGKAFTNKRPVWLP